MYFNSYLINKIIYCMLYTEYFLKIRLRQALLRLFLTYSIGMMKKCCTVALLLKEIEWCSSITNPESKLEQKNPESAIASSFAL